MLMVGGVALALPAGVTTTFRVMLAVPPLSSCTASVTGYTPARVKV